MRIFKILWALIIVFSVLPVGISLLYISLGLTTFDSIESLAIQYVEPGYYTIYCLISATFLIMISILIFLRLSKKIKKQKNIKIIGQDGEINLSTHALEELMKKIAANFGQITSSDFKVSGSRKGLKIISNVAISGAPNVSELIHEVQMELSSYLQSILGVDMKISVVMNVSKITPPCNPQENHQELGENRQ
ncbi:MAG: alkaline shock response membrane anchor protein AmaP [Candidatus Omnitrophica bacterium]|nr:alkaline shock response membrane anchor protein AmaP [Candidatus Omnitrophota bacterium]